MKRLVVTAIIIIAVAVLASVVMGVIGLWAVFSPVVS